MAKLCAGDCLRADEADGAADTGERDDGSVGARFTTRRGVGLESVTTGAGGGADDADAGVGGDDETDDGAIGDGTEGGSDEIGREARVSGAAVAAVEVVTVCCSPITAMKPRSTI